MVDMFGWNQRKKKDWYYPDIESSRRPIPHCAEVPVSVFTSLPNLTADKMLLEVMDDTDSSDSSSSSSVAAAPSSLSQGQLNDLVCDYGLFKESFEIVASCLGEHSILHSGIKLHSTMIGMIC